MAYRFKHVEHQVYKNTFLKDVRIVVEFTKVDIATVNAARMQKYFNKFDGANIRVEDFLERGNINIYSENHAIDFSFSLSYAEAKLCTPPYSSFDDAEGYWSMLMDFLVALNIKEVSRLVVRKFNALYFTPNATDYDIRDVMSSLFCDELMQNVPDGVSQDRSWNSFERSWTEPDDEGKTEMEVVYGIKRADSAEKKDHLTLVTMVKSKNVMIPVDDVMAKAREYNQILFDAFHWCVKEDIINSMK